MNTMSVSPVKPPLNPATLPVPSATATNLSKSALPANNNFGALNLIPESKGAAPVPAVPTVPEKMVDTSTKAPQTTPTSNGSVSPLPDTAQSAAVPAAVQSIQNCNDKNETAQNLSTNSAPPKTENTVEEPPKAKVDVEKKKEEKKDEKKPSTETKASSSGIKDTGSKDVPAQNPRTIETPPATESSSVKKDVVEEKTKDEKKPEVTSLPSESVPVENATPSPAKKETNIGPSPAKTVPEEKKPVAPAKEETDSAKKEAEPVSKKKAETCAPVQPAPVVKTESTPKTANPPKATKRKAKAPVESIAEEESADGRKSKRTRLPTTPYQSPIPELQLIAKMSTTAKTTGMANDKIIAFYKNEFLAVRNPEGSFYICQAFQNIHRSSSKIKIRWFTNLPQNIYTPDFYDTTEFDCILTNVTMSRVEKDRWKLPDAEQVRIENILKRALDVEKGVVEQLSVTEEHPDGLDLSLYKDEAQLQKRKKKAAPPPKKDTPPEPKKTPTKKAKKATKSPQKSSSTSTSPAAPVKKSARVSSYVNRDTTDAKSKVSTVKVAEKPTKAVEKSAKKEKKEKKKKKGKSAKKPANSSAASKTADSASLKTADSASSKTWEPSVKASNSSKVVLSLRKDDSSPTKTPTAPETKGTKRTSSVSLRASAAAAAAAAAATPAASASGTAPPAKRRKEEAKTSPSSASTTTVAAPAAAPAATATPTTTAEKIGKVRNAGSAVSAKINSAAIRTTKEKERKAVTPASQRKK